MELIFDLSGQQNANETMDDVVNTLYRKKHKIDKDTDKLNANKSKNSETDA